MKYDVSYIVASANTKTWYSEDTELNFDGSLIEAASAGEVSNNNGNM